MIRVVVVDDHAVVRAGVKAELAADSSIRLVGEAEDVTSAVRIIQELVPDVVLLDVHLPVGVGLAGEQCSSGQAQAATTQPGGAEVIRQCADLIHGTPRNPGSDAEAVSDGDGDGGSGSGFASAPGSDSGSGSHVHKVRFLAISVSDAAHDVIAVIRAGARGYVTKSISGPDLCDAVRRVASGDAVFSPRLAGFVLDSFGATQEPPAAEDDESEIDRLSAREQEVMRLIARGYTYKEAASRLYLSVKTVETHMTSVLRKLQLTNRGELTHWAVTRKLL